MEFITKIKRWQNSRRLDQVRFTMESNGDVCAYDGMWLIGKLQIIYSTTPTEGAIAHGLASGESFLTIGDMVIKDESWQRLGIGSQLLSECIGLLKQTMQHDTVVDGRVTDRDVVEFWRRFGFQFQESGEKLFMACRLYEIVGIKEKGKWRD